MTDFSPHPKGYLVGPSEDLIRDALRFYACNARIVTRERQWCKDFADALDNDTWLVETATGPQSVGDGGQADWPDAPEPEALMGLPVKLEGFEEDMRPATFQFGRYTERTLYEVKARSESEARAILAAGEPEDYAIGSHRDCECEFELGDVIYPTHVWAAGWNIPGYLPDEPAEHFHTWDEARAYLDEELERAGDDFTHEDGQQEIVDQYAAARQLLELVDSGDEHENARSFMARVGNYVWWIERIAPREQ